MPFDPVTSQRTRVLSSGASYDSPMDVKELGIEGAWEITPKIHGDDRGASLVEYALLVALIAIVCIVAVAFFGGATGDTFSRVGSSVNAVPPT